MKQDWEFLDRNNYYPITFAEGVTSVAHNDTLEALRAARLSRQNRDAQTTVSTSPVSRLGERAAPLPWLFSWDALRQELAAREKSNPDPVKAEAYAAGLLHAVIKLAPRDDEGAQVLNCVSHYRSRWARSMSDLQYAAVGFRAASTYAQGQLLRWKCSGNYAWILNILGAPTKAHPLLASLYTELPQDHPFQFFVRYQLGFAWSALGAYSQAETAFLSCLGREQNTQQTGEVYTALAAQAAYQLEFYRAADRLAQAAAEVRPGPAWILDAYLDYQLTGRRRTDLVLRGIDQIELELLGWRDRYSLAFGYELLARFMPGKAGEFKRMAQYYAGSCSPAWLLQLVGLLLNREVS